MNSRFPAAAAFLKEEDISIELLSSGASFCFDVASGEQSLFTSGKILDEVSAYLRSVFCGAFYGNVRIVEKEREEISLDELPADDGEEYVQTTRFFPVCNFRRLDGADARTEICRLYRGLRQRGKRRPHPLRRDYLFTGKSLYQKERKDGRGSGKSAFFADRFRRNGQHARHLFSQKGHSGKNPRAEGGRLGGAQRRERGLQRQCFLYGEKDQLRYRARKFCTRTRKGKPVPAVYRTVFPEPYVDYTQAGFFDRLEKPDDLKNNTFVVFDLETTA